MNLSTSLPLAAIAFKHWGPDDAEILVIVAKAAFRWEEGLARAEDVPPELALEDVMDDGPEGYSPVLREQDTAPGKTGTDLLIKGTARSPGCKPLQDWPVAVCIPNIMRHEFHVRGPSEWRRGPLSWALTQPEPVTEVPLTYALAYGGAVPPGAEPPTDPQPVYEMNPAGRGFVTAARLNDETPFAAPQIGLLADFMANDPLLEMRVCGTMPIAKGWLPRRVFAGTFDENWQRTRHPRMPPDYSYEFWNQAPTALQLRPGLRGDESIVLEGMSHIGPVKLPLPSAGVVAYLPDAPSNGGGATGQAVDMALDTVKIDAQSIDPRDWSVDLTWRRALHAQNTGDRLELHGVEVSPRDRHGEGDHA